MNKKTSGEIFKKYLGAPPCFPIFTDAVTIFDSAILLPADPGKLSGYAPFSPPASISVLGFSRFCNFLFRIDMAKFFLSRSFHAAISFYNPLVLRSCPADIPFSFRWLCLGQREQCRIK